MKTSYSMFSFNCRGIKRETLKINREIIVLNILLKAVKGDFPGGTVVENLPANAGDTGSSPGPGRSHMPRSN